MFLFCVYMYVSWHFCCLFFNGRELKGMELGGWGGSGKSLGREKRDQNISYEKIQLK